MLIKKNPKYKFFYYMCRYIGIGCWGHDANIAVIDKEGNLVLYSQSERLSRKKHDFDLGDLRSLFARSGLKFITRDDVIFCSDPERAYPAIWKQIAHGNGPANNYNFNLLSGLTCTKNFYFISHHLAHAASSFMFREESITDAVYVAYDGAGLTTNMKWGHFSCGSIGEDHIEEMFLDHDEALSPRTRLERLPLPNTDHVQVAGKIMGLAGYMGYDGFQYLHRDHVNSTINRYKREGLSRQIMSEYRDHYYSFISDAKNYIDKHLKQFPNIKTVVVGGGVFLALEINTHIAEHGGNLIFGPPINDSGQSIGLAGLAYFHAFGRFPPPIKNPFVQWSPTEKALNYESPKTLADKLVSEDLVIGLMLGQAEAGPRALGHRSLLALPSESNRKRVSEEIKGREFYRPVAPIVTDRQFHTWFSGPKGRYMQFRNYCEPHAKNVIPGVVHRDNTARVQVLYEQDNPWLYELLCEVGRKTGAECLINTSLNGRGKPICNTLSDAERELDGMPIHLIRFP